MKKALFIMLVAAYGLIGCKASNKVEPTNTIEGIGSISAPKERNFTASELTIGRRICSALKHKRELFETLTDMQEKMRMAGELRNCQSANAYNVAEFTVTISNSSSTDFEYVATSRTNYFKDVVTDQYGPMESICDSLGKSDAVSNTMLSGSSYLYVNFLISDGYDRFEISKKAKDGAGNYYLASTEGVSVVTQKNQADEKFFGMEKERIRYTPCPDSKTLYNYTKQTWVAALTPFPVP